MWSQICSSSMHSVGNWWNMQTKVSQADSHNIRYPLYQFICFSPSQANLHNCYLKSFLQILPFLFLFYTAAEYFYFGLGKFDLHTPPSFHTSTNPPPPFLSHTHTPKLVTCHNSQALDRGLWRRSIFPFFAYAASGDWRLQGCWQ